MKTKYRIFRKIIVLTLIISFGDKGLSFQKVNYPGYYDVSRNRYILNRDFFRDERNYLIFKKYLNDAIFNSKDEGFKKIIDYNFNNYDILLLINSQINEQYIEVNFKGELKEPPVYYDLERRIKESINKEYQMLLLEYYSRKCLQLKEKTLMIMTQYQYIGEEDWLHRLLLHDSRMLPIFRHLIKHYYPYFEQNKNDDYAEVLSVFPRIILSDFGDKSINEILNKEKIKSYTRNIKNKDISIRGSSYLGKNYGSQNLLDFDLNTTWAEGSVGDGTGEWLEITLPEKTFITKVVFFPGYGKSLRLFKENNRVKKIKVESDDYLRFFEFEDQFSAQRFYLLRETNRIKITIMETYKGSKYNDLCISELLLRR